MAQESAKATTPSIQELAPERANKPTSAAHASAVEGILAAGESMHGKQGRGSLSFTGGVKGLVRTRSRSFWLLGGVLVVSTVARTVRQRRAQRFDVTAVIARAESRRRVHDSNRVPPAE